VFGRLRGHLRDCSGPRARGRLSIVLALVLLEGFFDRLQRRLVPRRETKIRLNPMAALADPAGEGFAAEPGKLSPRLRGRCGGVFLNVDSVIRGHELGTVLAIQSPTPADKLT